MSANSSIGTPGDGSSSAGILLVGGSFFGNCGDAQEPCPLTKNVLIGLNSTLTATKASILLNNDVGVLSSTPKARTATRQPPRPT